MRGIVDRMRVYLEAKGVSISVAEHSIGVSNASLSKPFKNGTTIKTDTLEKFLNVYSDINPEWLLYEEGSMLKTKSKDIVLELKEPIEEYGVNFKERFLESKYVIDLQKKYISKIENELSIIRDKNKLLEHNKKQTKV